MISSVYADVLQRDPRENEVDRAIDTELASPRGVLNLMRTLLFTEEFLQRFALTNSPLFLARMLINQVLGRAPVSDQEIADMATQILGNGWKPAVEYLLSQPDLHRRIASEIEWRREQSREMTAASPETAKHSAKTNGRAESAERGPSRVKTRGNGGPAHATRGRKPQVLSGKDKERRAASAESRPPAATPGRSKKHAARGRHGAADKA